MNKKKAYSKKGDVREETVRHYLLTPMCSNLYNIAPSMAPRLEVACPLVDDFFFSRLVCGKTNSKRKESGNQSKIAVAMVFRIMFKRRKTKNSKERQKQQASSKTENVYFIYIYETVCIFREHWSGLFVKSVLKSVEKLYKTFPNKPRVISGEHTLILRSWPHDKVSYSQDGEQRHWDHGPFITRSTSNRLDLWRIIKVRMENHKPENIETMNNGLVC